MFLFETICHESKTAVVTDDGLSYTFSHISDFSETIHKLIPRRSLVFCLSQNTVGSLFGYISFLSGSIVAVMLDSRINKTFLDDLINTYNPAFLWLPDGYEKEFKNCELVFSKYNYSLIELQKKNNIILHPDLAILLTTSGSTGSPKFVRISYENLKENAKSISSYLSITENERPAITLPMWYSYGLSIINSHLLKGATLLLTSKTIVEKEFWDFLRIQNATSLSGVPYTFEILKKLKFSEMHLPHLKTLTQAGGKLKEEVNNYFSEYSLNSGKRFFVMYGQTEATARMSYLSPEYSIQKMGSIGQPVNGGEFNLVDEHGTKITEADITGELVYKGKNVCMGYSLSNNDLKNGDENNGVLFTGDLAKKDEDNFYYIVGRKNRFIKLFGNRLNLDELENLLAKITPDCACTGTDNNLLIFTTDRTRSAEIKNYLSDKTGIHPGAFTVMHCDKIPRNAAGKINYSLLEK